MTPQYWDDAKKHLSKNCPKLKKIIKTHDGILKSKKDGYFTLMRSIVGQQISVKAADSVWLKFERTVGEITPKKILKTDDAVLRSCGLSGQKVAYVKNISEFFHKNKIDNKYWKKFSDEEILKQLTSIKGVGTWTAEMFMIFFLLRPDIFPVKDIGVLKAIDIHFNHSKRQPDKKYIKIAETWKPYRTVATWYLWSSLDPVAVAY